MSAGKFVLIWALSSLPALLLLLLVRSISFWGVIVAVPLAGLYVGYMQSKLLQRGLHWQPQHWVPVTMLAMVGAVMGTAVVLALVVPLRGDLAMFGNRLLFYLVPLVTFRLLLSAPQSFLLGIDIHHAYVWLLANIGGAVIASLRLAISLPEPAALLDVVRLELVLVLLVPAALNAGALVWLRQHEPIADSEHEPMRVAAR
jgi:hypothetical protein